MRLEAVGRLPSPSVRPPDGGDARDAVIGTQTMRLPDGARRAPVYDRSRLAAGEAFTGPAVVAQLDATTLVPPGWRAEVVASGALLLRWSEAVAPASPPSPSHDRQA